MSKILGISLALAMALVAIPLSMRAMTPHDTVNNGATLAHQAFGAHTAFGPDGKLIGAAAAPSVRSHFQRNGLPE
jgi:hypothetical protein